MSQNFVNLHFMKPISFFITFIVAIVLSYPIVGQNQSHLTIGVYMKPDGYSKIDSDQVTKLETRIISVIASGGSTFNVSASRITPNAQDSSDDDLLMLRTLARGVVCYPKFEVFNVRVADTGMKKITVVDASLTMSVQYIHEDIIFSSLVLNLQGSGNNEYQAINDAIRNIRPQDPRWQSFVQETREKIIKYYDTHCDAIIAKAKQLDRIDRPLSALQIIWPIPQDVDCYERVKELTVEIYMRAINQDCRQKMLAAKAALAANQYEIGLNYLRHIDTKSDCYESVLEMIDRIAVEVDKAFAQERANNLEIEKIRLQIEKDRNSSYPLELFLGRSNTGKIN